MYGIFELLFGRIDSGPTIIFVAARLIGVLLVCAGLFLLGRRNETGWWLALLGLVVPVLSRMVDGFGNGANGVAGLLPSLASFAILLLLSAGVAVYGLQLFRKQPLESGMTRAITLKRSGTFEIMSPMVMAVVYGAASLLLLIAFVINVLGFDGLSRISLLGVLFSGILGGLLPAGLLGLANRTRWAWFLIVAVSVVSLWETVNQAAGSVLVFLYLLQGALAFYGWCRWGSIPYQPASSSPTPAKRTF